MTITCENAMQNRNKARCAVRTYSADSRPSYAQREARAEGWTFKIESIPNTAYKVKVAYCPECARKATKG